MNNRPTTFVFASLGLLGLVLTGRVLAQGGMPLGAPGGAPPGMIGPGPAAGMPPGAQLMPGMPGATDTSITESEGATDVGVSDDKRDPFWPIGWVPGVPGVVDDATNAPVEEVVVAPTIEWPEIVMKGSILAPDGSYWAQIDKIGWVKSGDTVVMKHEGTVFKWKINKVTDGAISIKKLEANPVQK